MPLGTFLLATATVSPSSGNPWIPLWTGISLEVLRWWLERNKKNPAAARLIRNVVLTIILYSIMTAG